MNEQSFELGKVIYMRYTSIKKPVAILTFITLALAVSLTFGLMGRRLVNAKSRLKLSNASISSSSEMNASSQNTTFAAQSSSIGLPKTSIYALNADNTIFALLPGGSTFLPLGRVTTTNGSLIGIDFRVSDGRLYALTDTGSLYTIGLTSSGLGAATLVSNLSPRFAGRLP